MTLVSFGKLVGYDLEVAEKLEKEGISVEVTRLNCYVLSPTLQQLLSHQSALA